MSKRQKTAVTTTTETTSLFHNIWTPFHKCQNFEPHILYVIDKYLTHKISKKQRHWFVAWGLSDEYGQAFYDACAHGDIQAVKLLYEKLPNYHNEVIKEGFEAAAEHGHLHIVKYLKSLCVDVSYITFFAVHCAASNGHLHVVKYLVNLDAVLLQHINRTLCFAASNGHLNVVKYLVSVGADITYSNHQVLRCASFRGHLNIVKYLVNLGADVTAERNLAVLDAAENGYLEIVKYLVSLGADVFAVDNYALRQAANNGHLETVKYLVSLGADVRNLDHEVITEKNKHTDVVQFLQQVINTTHSS